MVGRDTIMSCMGFFDDMPPQPPPVEASEPEPPPWMGPPPGWVGGWVPWHLVIMRNPDVYAVVTDVQAFPSGVLFTLLTRVRPGALPSRAPMPDPPLLMSMGSTDGPLFGVGFADGRKTAVHAPLPTPGEGSPGPVLSLCGGGGGGGQERLDVWLWPLPPEGPLSFAAAWPALGLEETVTTVDATELVAAAGTAERLWPADGRPGRGGSSVIEIRHPRPPPGVEPE